MSGLSTSMLTACDSDDGFQDCMSENEEDEVLMKQEVVALEHRMKTVGIRDGLEIGKEETLQQGFDQGYALGAAKAFRIGQLRGMLGTAVACGLVQSNMVTQVKVCMLKLRTLERDIANHKDCKMDNDLFEETLKQAGYMLKSLGMDQLISQKPL